MVISDIGADDGNKEDLGTLVFNPLKYAEQYEILLCPLLPNTQRNMALFEGSQVSPACLSDKGRIEIVSVDQWCSDSDR